MPIMYYGTRSGREPPPRFVCVGTPEQISFMRHGGRPPLGLRVVTLHCDPATGSSWEQQEDLSARRTFPNQPGKPRALRKRWDIRKSSREFDWGRLTPGALQLAVAILAEFLGEASIDEAIRQHEKFARSVIAKLPPEQWELSDREVNFCLSVEFIE
jgi:hypothetical protein